MVPLLGLNKDRISMTEEQFSNLMDLQTFSISTPEVTTPVTVSTEELLSTVSTTTPASSEEQAASTTTDASTSSSTEFPDNFREPRDESTTESSEVTEASTASTIATEDSSSTTTEAAVVTEASPTSPTEATTLAAAEASTDVTTAEEPDVTEESTTEATETTSSVETSVETTPEAATEAATEASTTTVEPTEAPEITTTVSNEERLAGILASNELLAFSTFLDYEPDTDNFDKIPALNTLILTCDMLTASGDAASSISSSHLSSMASADLMNCLETLGRIHWPEAAGVSIWNELKTKLALFQDPSLKPIKRDLMIQLHNLLPAIATNDANLIDVSEDNIDGISLIGM